MQQTYDGNSIAILEGLEAVRKRPGMYIGSVSYKGLNHLIYEIVDNAVDEHLAGFCDQITVTLSEDGTATIEDNGRGIPVGINDKTGLDVDVVAFHARACRVAPGLAGTQVESAEHPVGGSHKHFPVLDDRTAEDGLAGLMLPESLAAPRIKGVDETVRTSEDQVLAADGRG